MMKLAKRAISLLCILSMLFSMLITVQASSSIKLTVGSTTVEKGTGAETVELPITISNNTGIIGMTLTVNYDEGLALTNVKKGDAFTVLTMTKPGDFSANPIRVTWDGEGENDYGNGTAVTLSFTVPRDTEKEYPITISVSGVIDENLSKVTMSTEDGKITVGGQSHTHSFGDWTNVDDNNHKRECACGEIETKSHNWGEGEITTQPTHLTEGVKTYTCADCGATKTEAVAKTPEHTYGEWVKADDDNHKKTCECGNVVIEAHAWDEGKVTTAATHTTTGVKTYTCSECKATKTEVIPADVYNHTFGNWTKMDNDTHSRECACGKVETKAHNWNDGVVTTQPTHLTEGVKTYTCSDCGATKTETVKKTPDHTYGEWVKADDTNHKKTCECGDVVTEAHKWDEGVVTKEATHTTDGEKTYTCTVCNATKSETIPADADNHTFGKWTNVDENNHERECACGKKGKAAHNWNDGVITTQPTHLTEGVKTFTCVDCGATKTETFKKASQTIVIADVEGKTYGDESFKLDVTPDTISQRADFTYVSSDEKIATVNAEGVVTIKGAGEVTIFVTEAGDDEYATTTVEKKITIDKRTIGVTAIDLDNKTVTLDGVLSEDEADVALDFDKIKTTVLSTSKTTENDITTVTTTIKISNFKVTGEKADNYTVATNASLDVNVVKTTVAEPITGDNNVTIEAAPVDNKTIIVTDIAFAPETEVEKISIDATEVQTVNAVAITKAVIDAIVEKAVPLEISITDGTNAGSISFDVDTLTAIQNAGNSANILSVSMNIIETDELEVAQKTTVETHSAKTPIVYSLSVNAEDGSSVAADFGTGRAKVKLPYEKPAGNGNIVVQFLKPDGTVETISNPRYNVIDKTVEVELGHFSEYLIYTEPVITSGGGGGVSRYTVKFETNGGSKVANKTVNKNVILEVPEAPTKDGFKFDGWYTDKELTTAYDFSSRVTKSFTLYAKWTENEKDAEKEPTIEEVPFKDIKTTDWFYENVKYVVDNNLMNGVTDDKFAPNDTLTRAMLVTVLYRNAGEPAVNKSIPFADVDMSSWYANAVLWAKQNDIVSGVSENEFAPNTNITREQIATIMYRYAQYKEYDVSVGESTNILSYNDADSISEYAIAPMQYAVGSGLINGKTNSTLNPKDNATRAEIAAILRRFIENK